MADDTTRQDDTPDAEPTSSASLAEAMTRVYADMARVKKSGWNDRQKYHFAQEGDIVDMVRASLHRHGIALSVSMNAPSDRWQTTSKGGGAGTGCTVHLTFTLRHADTGQHIDCQWEGDATDYTDKALPKAITAAKKSWLVATFLISTGDVEPDAEGTEAVATAAQPDPRDRPASQAMVRRAFALATEHKVDPMHLRLSAHLLTRTADNPDGRSINALTIKEMDALYVMVEGWENRPAQWDERMGKMAARLDAQATPPPDPATGEPADLPEHAAEVAMNEAVDAAGDPDRVQDSPTEGPPHWTPPAGYDAEDDVPF